MLVLHHFSKTIYHSFSGRRCGRDLIHRSRYNSTLSSIGRNSSDVNANNDFQGVWPIIATPFHSDETVDYKSFEKTIDFFTHDIGVNGCTIIGVLGESNRLVEDERKKLISIATSISDKICVGTSHPGTHATLKLSEQAIEHGAHSVMITPSKEPVPDQSTIVQYYKNIYQGLGDTVPIVLQDHPASTLVHMTMDSMKTIIQECPSVKCVKLESLPTPPKIRALVPWIEENNRQVSILTGLGALYGLFDLQCGTNGFMTGFAFPEILQAMYQEQIIRENDSNAKMLYQKYLPLIVFEQQPGVALRKEIYKLRGIIDCTHVRHPGKNIPSEHHDFAVGQLEECIDFVIGDNVDLTQKIPIPIPIQSH